MRCASSNPFRTTLFTGSKSKGFDKLGGAAHFCSTVQWTVSVPRQERRKTQTARVLLLSKGGTRSVSDEVRALRRSLPPKALRQGDPATRRDLGEMTPPQSRFARQLPLKGAPRTRSPPCPPLEGWVSPKATEGVSFEKKCTSECVFIQNIRKAAPWGAAFSWFDRENENSTCKFAESEAKKLQNPQKMI